MLNHSKPYIRKRAIIAVYKALVKYPEATPFAITRLKEKLEDQDPGKEFAVKSPQIHESLSQALLLLPSMSCVRWFEESQRITFLWLLSFSI
jgi:hypothetical protein